MTKKQMKLGAFINLPGHHVASWRHPSSGASRAFDLEYLTEIAQTAERGKFDMVFFADVLGQKLSGNAQSSLKLDPVIIISALAAVTKNIGLTATLTTTYNDPYHVARKFAAIDHLSKGRAAWNVVTSANEGKLSCLVRINICSMHPAMNVQRNLWRLSNSSGYPLSLRR